MVQYYGLLLKRACPNTLVGAQASSQPVVSMTLLKNTSGAADTAPELMRLLDLNITFQTVRNSLKKAGPKSAVNVEMPMLSRACGGDGWNLLWSTTTGLWRTGAVLFGHMGLI
jgi:hypothetical protein